MIESKIAQNLPRIYKMMKVINTNKMSYASKAREIKIKNTLNTGTNKHTYNKT